jgi:aspartate carbamoyltransferase catalytic subunit
MGALSRKHFLDLEFAPKEDLQKIIDTAYTFKDVLDRPIKKYRLLPEKMLSTCSLKTQPEQECHLNLQKKDCPQM